MRQVPQSNSTEDFHSSIVGALVATREAAPQADPPPPTLDDKATDPPMADSKGLRRPVLEWTLVLVGAFVLALAIRQFMFQAFWIESESMQATLEVEDRVLVNRLSYSFGEASRGDVVVFSRLPNEPGQTRDLIKRVIGLPGDTVEGRGNKIYIDGIRLAEPYLDAEGNFFSDFGPVLVPENEIFVMGDNRQQSFDSRRFGTIEMDRAAGRAFITFWPLDRIGSL